MSLESKVFSNENKMSQKSITLESYQKTAHEFAANVKDLAPLQSINEFIDLLPSEAKILDLGCGSGRDAKIFSEKGLSVAGIDFCQNLIDIAKTQAPLAEFQVIDIEHAEFPDNTFDGVWAGCTLIHIPKKDLPDVLAKIHRFLKKNGYFFLSLKKGDGEGVEKDSRYEGIEKFLSLSNEDDMQKILTTAHFEIVDCKIFQKQASYHSHDAIRIFCKKV